MTNNEVNIDVELPHLIYFNDDHSKTNQCTEEISEWMKCTYSLPDTWKKLSEELEQDGKFLVFHADMIAKSIPSSAIEFVDAIRTVCRFMPNAKNLKIGVIIKKDTPLKVVKELQKTSVQGILFDTKDFSADQTAKSINALINGIPYWPSDVLKTLPGSVKHVVTEHSIALTQRQTQVFSLIKERGASNKIIAKVLGISESTVKLHVSEIFKKYGVRTRTQLAVFSNMS